MSKPLLLLAGLALSVSAQNAEKVEFFEKNIRPLLATECQMCHNAKAKTSGLDMSTGDAFMAGGASGSLVNVETPEQSLLLRVLAYDGALKMPPTGKLKDHEIGKVREWIKMGAPWPGAGPRPANAAVSTGGTRKHGSAFTENEWKFWAFQPVVKPAAAKSIDAYLREALAAKNLKPAARADKTTLLRRVTYDLHGLPPTEEELAEFLADRSETAYAKVVERLLASPRYGEKWGRHWLDVARYADSTGNDEDHRYPYAWRYRDYVIEAFNNDLPFNQFIREQIAGDLMPPAPGVPVNRRGIVATGFLALGAKAIAQQDKKKMLFDVYDEQIDVLSKTFLGVTLACARCHDHKFDPLTQKDYYGMMGIFASTKQFRDSESHVAKLLFTPLVSKAEYEKYEAAQNVVANKGIDLEIVIDRERTAAQEKWIESLGDYMLAARANKMPQHLDERIFNKWVAHFKETEVPRPWLDAFHKGDNDAAVIAKFQESAKTNLAAWTKKMSAYRVRQRKQLEEKNMLSEMPKIIDEKDGFFRDVFGDGGPFGFASREVDNFASEAGKKELAALRAEQKKLKDALPTEPDMACGIEESAPFNAKVFVRGDYNALGDDAPKTFPLIVAGKDRPIIANGGGRRELAEWLAGDTNPLTARVIVNRVWNWHFGEGIVRTPDNFGRMGERPTHPELLDALTSQFVRDGWSIKKLHRRILLSEAYQMTSAASAEAVKIDPENRLFSRFPRRRLLVEEMRDGMLAISGKIDFAMGGTMQSGFGTDGENSSGRMSISPEEQTRRSVYLPLRRANLPALLNLFDFGDATTANGKRIVTNVAPQALFLMNSKFVAEQAGAVAKEIAGLPAKDRAERMYLKILNRAVTPAETDSALSYAAAFQKQFPKMQESDAWQSLARILFASNEFIYVD
jgi:cytochrome c553